MHDWLIAHLADLLVAAIFAVVFAVVVALLFVLFDVDSRIRSRIRQLKNKAAERSVARLRERIRTLEKYQDNFLSDKSLYLATLRIVLAILFSMSMSGTILLLGYSVLLGKFFAGFRPVLDLFALIFLLLALVGAWQGIRFTELDTKAKASEMVEKLNEEIGELKEKLLILEAS